MELIPLDDEELILIEEKTKQEEKGVSLTKTNRKKEPGENNKRGTTSVKKAMRERSEKTSPKIAKTKPKQSSKKQEWIQENKEGSPHKNRNNHNQPEAQKWTPDKQQTQKIQTTVPRKRENASEAKDWRSKLLSL